MGRTQRKRKQRKAIPALEGDDILGSLFKYMHSLGWRNETFLTSREFPGTGRGLCSKSHRIAVGDTLIRLPINSLITIETLEMDDAFKAFFNAEQFDKDHRISFQTLLALYILHQKHLGENSPMHAYLCSLPKQFSVPYFCTINELQCLPDALLESTVSQNRLIKDNYANVCQAIYAHCCSCCEQSIIEDIFPLSAFKWAYFAVNTRSVYVRSQQLRSSPSTQQQQQSFFKPLLKNDTNLALAPFLDLFNHSDKVSTSAELLTCAKHLNRLDYVLTLQHAPFESIPCYNQVFISYGSLPNLKLFIEYGFVLHENSHDYFEFSLLDIEHFLKQVSPFSSRTFHRNKFKFIREHNLHDQMFVHFCEGISHNLRVVLHLLLIEPSYFPNVLNQVAFGAVTQLDDLKEEIDLLIRFKINEYKGFIGRLQPFKTLTASGTTALSYMIESVRYLESTLNLI